MIYFLSGCLSLSQLFALSGKFVHLGGGFGVVHCESPNEAGRLKYRSARSKNTLQTIEPVILQDFLT